MQRGEEKFSRLKHCFALQAVVVAGGGHCLSSRNTTTGSTLRILLGYIVKPSIRVDSEVCIHDHPKEV
jgi:hypothetical protein